MSTLIDIANFNADASCFSFNRWMSSLNGGTESIFYKWLNLYVEGRKKICLGLTGSTISDIVAKNSEAIELINLHADIFEIILRPFAHDISILRSKDGFLLNFLWGKKSIKKEFRNISDFFLPPEFMLTNEQVMLLSRENVEGIFVNPERFDLEMSKRIPRSPYFVNGINDSRIRCIPIEGSLTNKYLFSIHNYCISQWNQAVCNREGNIFFWRDAESPFLIPDGLKREKYWLQNEDSQVKRIHLRELKSNFIDNKALPEEHFHSYPIHSFHAWMKEFRMLGYLGRVDKLEANLRNFNDQQKMVWLLLISSDILSSIEKKSPVLKIRKAIDMNEIDEITLYRVEKGIEGEEYLNILEESISLGKIDITTSNQSVLLEKLRNRLHYLKRLSNID